ncbi:RNA-binding protein Raly isoform X1 [Trichosurus vulpecula]|uniref:RNA-binding protein Raly isoform X1 n=1 Tax=Trichosurus vulpecula TaxID=9337 RepID=UPI00186AC08C|nr:RNA-binding protein Raly isoform X1 [Trichosurus vulpecula]XP_036605567.1 RNA-binding protein Raly isoform X1 [Trichosurus vulpecula]XP_036605568.1 RNA-binding protein Raly isoform X1 [Trichosurus vulpecula]XP_036605569.1 RNA-binding protein Raly isoform X1 [Trichosurus vulpecula]XP_036605570.1 RNA-binding protein Raly isoform X1 [Trichosurus vulpecula]
MSLKVHTSNITNKNDPKSLNSRVFIGNLNTAMVKKADVETIFSKYGRVAGCSVHKGYAFVQYASERHARAAVLGENGRVLAGQTLDINMAGEPKPNRPKGLKRAASASYGGYDFDSDYYREDLYDSPSPSLSLSLLLAAREKGFPAPSSGVQSGPLSEGRHVNPGFLVPRSTTEPLCGLRLFEPRGRLSPVPRVVPVKRPRVTIPLVRRIKATLPVRLFARSTTSSSSSKFKLKCTELQTIKTELTQIKYNIEALLGRLDQISEEQSPSTDVKKKNDSKKSEAPQEDTASEAETPLEELLPGDDGDEALAQDDFEDLDNSRYTELDELTLQ